MIPPAIRVSNMTIGYDNVVVLKNISFDVATGAIFVIMGPSGCGKSTLMRAMAGLLPPMRGSVRTDDTTDNIGVLFQGGALFTSMTVFDNVALPLMRHTDYSAARISRIVSEKLELVGLPNVGAKYPAQLSGGMKKRVGLARALALNPSVLYLDEPSAGLDPVSAGHQDDLILKINRELGTTIVMVSHDLDSIFAVADDAIFLDPATRTIAARGNPREMLRRPPNREVLNFLTRGKQ